MGITNFNHKSDLKKIMSTDLIELLDQYKFLDPLKVGPVSGEMSDMSIECSGDSGKNDFSNYH